MCERFVYLVTRTIHFSTNYLDLGKPRVQQPREQALYSQDHKETENFNYRFLKI